MHRTKLIALVIVFVGSFVALSLHFTGITNASSLTSASVTVTNSRMSYKALISSGAAGGSLITITAGSYPDPNTNHLFPGDKVCFTDAGNNVCRDNTTYTVDSIVDGTHFNITSPLTTALTATDYAVASQSGTWTIGFTTTNAVPVGGKIIVTVPANDANTPAQNNNGIPDSASGTSTNGFDMNGFTTANATVTGGCTPANWGTAGAATAVTVGGSGTTDTTISWTRTTNSCAGGSAITISLAGNGIVNPAPVTVGHTQGTADVYGVTLATTDGTNTIDSAVPRVAPVEAVLISANVDETLSFVVAGLTGGTQTYCGSQTYIATTATSVPWGHIAATTTFYYAAQQLTVNTNAASGYAVTVQENDQMGKNGNVCTGASPSSGQYTFGTGTCIRDTACSASACNYNTTSDWTDAVNYVGLGYSESSVSGTDAPFYYSEKTRTFSTKELPDQQAGSQPAQTIMSNSGPVSNSQIDLCYRIDIPGTQPSGYYYNIVKYTATATF
jgi:hypothetical protein